MPNHAAKDRESLRTGERLTVTVESVGTDGLGRADVRSRGRTIELRIEEGLAGEELLVLVTHVGRRVAHARMLELRSPPARERRRTIPCPRWTAASPCRLMHLCPAAQSAFKQRRVAEALEDLGLGPGDAGVDETTVASSRLGWRCRSSYVLARDREGRLVLGAYRRGSHLVQDMAGCPLEEESAGRAAAVLRDVLEDFGVEITDPGLPVAKDGACGAPRDPRALFREMERKRRPRYSRMNAEGLRYVVVRSSSRGEVVAALLTPSGRLSLVESIAAEAMKRMPELTGVFVGGTGEGDAIFGREAPGPWATPPLSRRSPGGSSIESLRRPSFR